MEYGLFTMPSHPPERALYDGHQWDLQQLRWADELGFSEAWIGEHHTAPWEPHPSPDLPLLASFGFTEFLKHRPDVPDSDVTPEYCARHNWLVGSPATVTERLHQIYDEVGGFGTILLFCFDNTENPKAWQPSMELPAPR